MVNTVRAIFSALSDKTAKKRSYRINPALAQTLPKEATEAKW
jgi:hypothetical protein